MKNLNKQYKIKELSDFYGITPDVIRLYNSKGLVLPDRPDNGKDKPFDREDLLQLDYILRLKTMKFSLDEIDDVLNKLDVSGIYTELCVKLNELEKQWEELDKAIGLVKDYKQIIYNVANFEFSKNETGKDNFTICMSPILILKDIKTNMADASDEMKKIAPSSLHLLTMEASKKTIEELLELKRSGKDIIDKVKEEFEADFNFATSIEDDRRLSLDENFKRHNFRVIPGQKSIHYICQVNKDDNYENINKLIDYIINHNLEVNGSLVMRSLMETDCKKESNEYWECWLPIK